MNSDIESILETARSKKDENRTFLRSLRSQQKEPFFEKLRTIHDDVFAATDCLQCANCCKTTPALVTTADIKRISRHLGLNTKKFTNQFLIQDVNGEYLINRVPCPFLQQDHACGIYEMRPEACRRFPHTDEKDFTIRPELNLANTMVCHAAYQIVERLKVIDLSQDELKKGD